MLPSDTGQRPQGAKPPPPHVVPPEEKKIQLVRLLSLCGTAHPDALR